MTKLQSGVIAIAVVLFSVLYFGFNTKPKDRSAIEQSRAIKGESTGTETMIAEAKAQLSASQLTEVESLEKEFSADTAAVKRSALLKKISAYWYKGGKPIVSGIYAEQVAEIEKADSAWSVAGALYYEGLQKATEPTVRAFCAGRAVNAFESAASLNPNKPDHRVNLALIYAENPPADNPMKAVLMLRDLETKYPESAAVYNALGRLAIKTGQWDRAIARLEKSFSLDNKNPNTPCLLAMAYDGAGNAAKAAEYSNICK